MPVLIIFGLGHLGFSWHRKGQYQGHDEDPRFHSETSLSQTRTYEPGVFVCVPRIHV